MMMYPVSKKHFFSVHQKSLKLFRLPVSLICPKNTFQCLPDPKIVFIILIPENISSGQSRLAQVINK